MAKVMPSINLTGFEMPVSSAQQRRIIDAFDSSGSSMHSGRAGTLWVLLEHCQKNKIPYHLVAEPGLGFFIQKRESIPADTLDMPKLPEEFTSLLTQVFAPNHTTGAKDGAICNICKRPMNKDDDPTSENCGGDCLRCMADHAGDPDCKAKMFELTGDRKYSAD